MGPALLCLFIVLALGSGISRVKSRGDGRIQAADAQETLEIHFIDVGQGDATLITCGGEAMLIDAGGNDKGVLVQNYIRKRGVEKLDYLIVTHPDADHCGGADVILTKYDVDTVLMPDYAADTVTYRDVVKALEHKNYKVTPPVPGDSYRLGDAVFTVIAPNKRDYGDESNNYSVGILLEHGENRFIFTGDAEEEAEGDILGNGLDISADVLQVGHHGSRTSSTGEFLRAVDPEYAVVSCGADNEYGHPHAETLNTLRQMKVKVFRTDEQGSIVAVSDGRKITWNSAPSDTWKAGEPSKAGNRAGGTVQKQAVTYILNTKTKKFHSPDCSSLPVKYRSDSALGREEIMAQGYEPCKNCNP